MDNIQFTAYVLVPVADGDKDPDRDVVTDSNGKSFHMAFYDAWPLVAARLVAEEGLGADEDTRRSFGLDYRGMRGAGVRVIAERGDDELGSATDWRDYCKDKDVALDSERMDFAMGVHEGLVAAQKLVTDWQDMIVLGRDTAFGSLAELLPDPIAVVESVMDDERTLWYGTQLEAGIAGCLQELFESLDELQS